MSTSCPSRSVLCFRRLVAVFGYGGSGACEQENLQTRTTPSRRHCASSIRRFREQRRKNKKIRSRRPGKCGARPPQAGIKRNDTPSWPVHCNSLRLSCFFHPLASEDTNETKPKHKTSVKQTARWVFFRPRRSVRAAMGDAGLVRETRILRTVAIRDLRAAM